ncbi:MAG: AMP-binding protein, partial [Acidobacteriota bacterium]|nr:AMP-binding protein [Acidobacteriota bacterium]
YWLAELKDAPPLLELPTDRPRTATNAPVGGEVRFSLSSALTDALQRLSQASGATLFMTLLTGFQVLLARHSGQDDVVTGVPAASRTRAEVEGLIGLFVNTLPIRYRTTETLSFHDALQQTRIRVLEGFARQDVPFERIVEELHPERSLSYDPVTQVYFVLQNAPNEGLDIEGLMIEHIETSSGTVKGDLYLSMSERDGGLRGRLEYNAALFDPSTMQRFVEHFEVLLTAAAASPHSLVAQLPLLTQEERATLLHTWNATETAYDRAVCVHHLFEAQAQQQPDAVACVCGDESITYRELDLRSTRVARALRQQGLGRGSFVGLFLDRSLSMMVCLLGVMKSGAAYVPLDPAYPADRTQFILEDAQIGALVTHRHYADRFAQLSAPVFAVEDLTTTDAQGLPDIPLPRGAA